MKIIKAIVLITLCGVAISNNGLAQSTYPVSATTVLRPPYTPYLSDYINAGSDRLSLNMMLVDPVQPELQVRLRLRIEGKNVRIITNPAYMPPPITLQSFMAERLTGSDLRDYFNPNNLIFENGLSRAQFERTGALPAGFYRISFEVIEYHRSARVSNSNWAAAWIILNDPPIINTPTNGALLDMFQPQFVTFNWTPRHTGSPNSAFDTEYEFELVEIRQPNGDPNVAMLSSIPIHTVITRSTSITMGMADPQLQPGMRYAIRVRARSIYQGEELDLFKNNGYSQVVSFTYGRLCPRPENVQVQPLNTSQIKVSWDMAEQSSFVVKYKERSNPNAHWFEDDVYLDYYTISSLKPATAYNIVVLSKCSSVAGDGSNMITASTLGVPTDNSEFACGVADDYESITNTAPLDQLNRFDMIKVRDFKILVTEVTGSNGTFSGTGMASIPWFKLASFLVEFNNIKVNTDYQLYGGLIKSVYSKDSRFLFDIDTYDPLDDEEDDGVPNDQEDLNGDGDLNNDDTDGDGIPDYQDDDDDGDGTTTLQEDLNGDGDPTNDDTDGDGIANYLDDDDDGDGISSAEEDTNGDGDPTNDDDDGDGIPNYLDNHSGSGTGDDNPDPNADPDGDGIISSLEDEHIDGDGHFDNNDTDGDGLPNYLDDDDDNDGIPTKIEGIEDNTDGDGLLNYLDADDDNDGISTRDEIVNNGGDRNHDSDQDGIPDYLDRDDNSDGSGSPDDPDAIVYQYLKKALELLKQEEGAIDKFNIAKEEYEKQKHDVYHLTDNLNILHHVNSDKLAGIDEPIVLYSGTIEDYKNTYYTKYHEKYKLLESNYNKYKFIQTVTSAELNDEQIKQFGIWLGRNSYIKMDMKKMSEEKLVAEIVSWIHDQIETDFMVKKEDEK